MKSTNELIAENDLLRSKLAEANETLDAIRTGQVDALVVTGSNGHSLFTLESADHAYRVFIEQMAEGAVSLNSEGLVTYSNTQFARIIGRPLSDMIGHRFSDFIESSDKNQFQSLLDSRWSQNVKMEVRLVSGDSLSVVQLSLNRLETDDDNAVNLIVTDLTLQKQIETQLKSKNDELQKLNLALISSNHDLQQFASVASHDLQEPLRKIQVFSSFLKERSFDELSDASKIYVDKIMNCSQRMKVLIIDILSYSRLSAENSNIESVNIGELFGEILDDFDLLIMDRKAVVQVGDLCVVEGNKGQLRQVFHNLVSNALKFISPDRTPQLIIEQKKIDLKELGVALSNEDDLCMISVKDNGIGFEEKFSSTIFSLFETLNPKTSYEGSGIGLAIAKKIVDKHHGVIVANSIPGEGSEFTVILPLRQRSPK